LGMATIPSRVQVGNGQTITPDTLVARGQYRTFITPEVASQWLGYRREHQRQIRPLQVRRLATIMADGAWRNDHPGGIIFSTSADGLPSLDDGQHTLHAIVMHGQGVWCNVTTGASPDLYRYLGAEAPRSISDNNLIMSEPTKNKRFCSAISAARMIHTGQTKSMSVALFDTWCAAYRDPVVWIVDRCPVQRGICRSAVFVGVAEYRAILPERAERFADSILHPDGESQAGRMLRDYLLSAPANVAHFAITRRMYGATIACAVADMEERIVSFVKARVGWPDYLVNKMPQAMRECVRSI
jgi:hypothetical protein